MIDSLKCRAIKRGRSAYRSKDILTTGLLAKSKALYKIMDIDWTPAWNVDYKKILSHLEDEIFVKIIELGHSAFANMVPCAPAFISKCFTDNPFESDSEQELSGAINFINLSPEKCKSKKFRKFNLGEAASLVLKGLDASKKSGKWKIKTTILSKTDSWGFNNITL